jgi:hypothetical protein
MVIAIVVVVMIVVVIAVIPMIIAMVVVIVPMLVVMMLAIVGNIGIGIPVMPDEVDRLAACVVLAAMMAPIALISRPHMQIDRRRQRGALNTYAHDRRAVDKEGSRRIADFHASVKSRVAQADGNPDLCECCAAEG